MTVDQLREALAEMPGHIPVHVAVDAENGSGQGISYLYTLDCVINSFPTQGRMAVIRINYEPR